MTIEIFRADAYQRSCTATITAVLESALELDQTVFYPMGGGQPGDIGQVQFSDGQTVAVVDTRKGEAVDSIVHYLGRDVTDRAIGETVTATIDWDRRHRLMRIHTCLHLLSAVITAGVTGGSIRDGSGRLDFDLPESTLDKEEITDKLNALIEADHAVTTSWITDEELRQQPELVKTMSVQPPTGQGTVRLLQIEGIDLQPCGGTHVQATGEIGRVRVSKIEKKGKHNRRVNIVLEDV